MSRIVCYIPSYNDSPLVEESIASSPGWEIVISDNASAEPHRTALAALANERVQVIRHDRSLGRVGNWRFCVDHFIGSGATWMKFLMAGDRHKPLSLDIFRHAVARYPDVRFMIGQIENVWPDRRQLWTPTATVALISPRDVMAEVVRKGSVLYGLIAALIHVESVRDGFDFCEGALNFCADMQFLTLIAMKTPTLYVPEPVAECVVVHRKYLPAKIGSLEHFLEESLVRLCAADAFGELSGDRAVRNQLVTEISQRLRASLDSSPENLLGRG